MRVLHLIQRYHPARGGAEIHLGELSTRLAAEGHRVTVATSDALDFEIFWDPHRRRVPELQGEHGGVRILRFPVRHLPLPGLAYPACRRLLWLLSALGPVPVSLLAHLSRWTPWVPGFWEWLDTTGEPFDVVAGMTICFEPLLEAGLRFARKRRIPFVAYPLTHLGAGPRPGDDALSRFYTMRHQLALMQHSDAVVAQTRSERDFYARHGVSPDRIVVAGPGVTPADLTGGDGQRFRSRHHLQGPVVAFLSSMSCDKGTVHLVEAVRRLWRAGKSLDLVLAGTILSPFRRYLDSLPAPERNRILVLGPIDDPEKQDLLAGCDVMAVPSRTDSFGIIYLEAWLYRKPVIGACTWGVNDVIEDGQDGLLAPFGDVEALAGSISFLLDHPDEAAAMGARGEVKTRQFHTWDRKYEITRDLYLRLADAQKAA